MSFDLVDRLTHIDKHPVVEEDMSVRQIQILDFARDSVLSVVIFLCICIAHLSEFKIFENKQIAHLPRRT